MLFCQPQHDTHLEDHPRLTVAGKFGGLDNLIVNLTSQLEVSFHDKGHSNSASTNHWVEILSMVMGL